MLIVDPVSDVEAAWVLRADGDTNGLRPPITYGTNPAGTYNIIQPWALQPGTSYRARLFRATGDTTFPFEGIGAAGFTQ